MSWGQGGYRKSPSQRVRELQEENAVLKFNAANPVGTSVRFWTGARDGEGRESKTRSLAQLMCGQAVVWVEGHGACISLSHVEVTP